MKQLLALLLISGFLPMLGMAQTTTKRIQETFLDSESKPLYPVDKILAISGEWTFSDALVTASKSNDIRIKSPRLLASTSATTPAGYIETDFDIANLKQVDIAFFGFADDHGFFAVEVFVSKDKGRNWVSLGKRRGDITKQEETMASFKVKSGLGEEYRVRIANASQPIGNRMNRINITEINFYYE